MLVGIPLLILSVMFIASLKRKRLAEGVTVKDVNTPANCAYYILNIPTPSCAQKDCVFQSLANLTCQLVHEAYITYKVF
jgi:hypothetical protein